MPNTYDVGDVIRLTGSFTDADGVAVDPSTVACKVKDPSNTITTYNYPAQVTKEATGVYYTDIAINADGDWWYRFESTGTGQAAGEKLFWARVSQF